MVEVDEGRCAVFALWWWSQLLQVKEGRYSQFALQVKGVVSWLASSGLNGFVLD